MRRNRFTFHQIRRVWTTFRGTSRRRQGCSIFGGCISCFVILAVCCLLLYVAFVVLQASGRAPNPGSWMPPTPAMTLTVTDTRGDSAFRLA